MVSEAEGQSNCRLTLAADSFVHGDTARPARFNIRYRICKVCGPCSVSIGAQGSLESIKISKNSDE